MHVNFRIEKVEHPLGSLGEVKHLRDHVKKEITRCKFLNNPSWIVSVDSAHSIDLRSRTSKVRGLVAWIQQMKTIEMRETYVNYVVYKGGYNGVPRRLS